MRLPALAGLTPLIDSVSVPRMLLIRKLRIRRSRTTSPRGSFARGDLGAASDAGGRASAGRHARHTTIKRTRRPLSMGMGMPVPLGIADGRDDHC